MTARNELIAAGLIVPEYTAPKQPTTEPVLRLTDDERRAAEKRSEAAKERNAEKETWK